MIVNKTNKLPLRNVICNSLYIPRKFKTTFYDILHLKNDCTPKEIKDSYIKLSKMYHPDKSSNSKKSHQEFLKINEAYNTLSKPNLRSCYDYELTCPQSASGPRKQNYEDDWSMYENPFFRKNYKTTGTSSKNNGYYGFKTIKKQSNSTIVFLCLLISIFGLSVQILISRKALHARNDKIMRETEENEKLLMKIRENANIRGNDLQIELLRQRMEEAELKRKGFK